MKLTRIAVVPVLVVSALFTSLPASAQQYGGTPQIQQLLGVMDQISAMGAAAQRDAQRQAALAALRARQEQIAMERLLAQIRANANARPVVYDDSASLSQLAFALSVQLGTQRSQQIAEDVMGPFRRNYHTALYGTPEERARMMRRLNAQGQMYAGAAAEQQTRNSIAQYEARVAASNARHRAIQDADAAETHARSVLNRKR